MPRIEAKVLALPQGKKTARQRWLAIDLYQRLGPDQIAGRPEQRMTAFDRAHLDTIHLPDRTAKDCRIDHVNARSVGTETALSDDQRQRDGVYAQNQRPFLGDDVQQRIDAISFDGGENRRMDGRRRPRMTARKSDQILVCFLGSAETLAQARHCPFFKGDDRCHCFKGIRQQRLISY